MSKHSTGRPTGRPRILSDEERIAHDKANKRRYHEANKDKAKATAKRWTIANRDKANACSREYTAINRAYLSVHKRERKYGITSEQQAQILERQGNACAICRQPFVDSRSKHVDHDHVTRIVRGFLCGRCNRAIGLMRDSVVLLRAAATYLENVPETGVVPLEPQVVRRELPNPRKRGPKPGWKKSNLEEKSVDPEPPIP